MIMAECSDGLVLASDDMDELRSALELRYSDVVIFGPPTADGRIPFALNGDPAVLAGHVEGAEPGDHCNPIQAHHKGPRPE